MLEEPVKTQVLFIPVKNRHYRRHKAGRNVSSILLIGVEQAPLDESDVIDRDARSVSHDYPMTYTIQLSLKKPETVT